MSTKSIPYVMKENYLQVTVKGKPFQLDSSHPTFPKIRRALKEKNWKLIPKLVNVAENLTLSSHGNVQVRAGVVFYKGKEIKSTLSKKILDIVSGGKDPIHMVKFMDNLYKNPSEEAIDEFYGWLVNNDLPITDDGCFLAYKSVDSKFKDEHTHKIDNSPGQIIQMARKLADNNWRRQCSSGFHICSKHYGLYGEEVMAVKCNPKDVLSAEGGKIRTVKYEVLKHLGKPSGTQFSSHGYPELEQALVVEIKKERKEMLRMLLEAPTIKRALKNRKISKKSLLKSSFARLASMVKKYDLTPRLGLEDKYFLEKSRKAAGLTIGQVAKQMGSSYKTVVGLEKSENPPQSQVDNYLIAIAGLTGIHSLQTSAITYPKPVEVAR